MLFAAGDEVRGRLFVTWVISEFDPVFGLYGYRRRLSVLIRELLKLHQPLRECACHVGLCELMVGSCELMRDHVRPCGPCELMVWSCELMVDHVSS